METKKRKEESIALKSEFSAKKGKKQQKGTSKNGRSKKAKQNSGEAWLFMDFFSSVVPKINELASSELEDFKLQF